MPNNLFIKLIRYAIFCIIIGILCLCLYSCSPSKRLRRLIRNHPELLVRDTIRFTDTVITQAIRTDTAFLARRLLTDTVTIYKDRLRIQLHQVRDSIFVSAQVAADTIVKHHRVPVDRIIYKDIPWRLAWYWVLVSLVCGVAIAFITIRQGRSTTKTPGQ